MHIIFKGYFHTMVGVKKLLYKIVYGNSIRIGKGTSFRNGFSASVEKNAMLNIGKNCFFNYHCILNAHEKIEIGDGSIFGPNVIIYDHDHDYKNNINSYVTDPVTIGKNCWVGGNTVILRGTKIGDNVVIAAGSVVTKEVSNNVIYVQKRETTIIKQ